MNTHEWALIIFTLLAQLSVGLLIATLIVRAYVASKTNAEHAADITDRLFYVVTVLMVLALIASFFHLGKLMHIIGAVPNLSTSWMSREVVTSVAFMILSALLAFLVWRKAGTESLRTALSWLTAIAGLFLLVTMSLTYMLPAQPAWNTWATPIMFLTTTLLLGVLGTGTVLVLTQAEIDNQIMKGIAIASIVLVGVELLIMPVYMAYLSTQGAAAIRSLNLMIGVYGWALALRLILVFVGGGILTTYLFANASVSGKEKNLAALAYSAFVLVLVGEVIGRFLFYATHYRIGV